MYQINNFKGIKVDDVTHRIDTGEIIKQYEDDKPFSTQWEADLKTRKER